MARAAINQRWPGYALALAVTALAALLRWAVPGVLQATPYLAFYPAVVTVAAFGGLGPGILATLLSFACVDLVFDATPGRIDLSDHVILGRLVMFFAGGVGVSFIAHLQRLARQREHQRADDLRASEAETRRQKDLLAVTLASIGDAVIVTDPRGHVTFLNGEAQRLTGWTGADAHGRPLPEVFHIVNEHTRQTVENPVDKVLRLGQVVGLANHTVLIARDARETPIDDSGAPIRNADGAVHGVVLVFRDITARRRAEEAMRQSEHRYRTVGETIPYGIWQTDAAGACTYVSDSFLEMTGLTWPQLEQFGWLHLLPEADRRPTQDHWLRCVRSGEDFQREHAFRSNDGTTRFVLAIGRPVHDAAGNIASWVGINLDITERKRLELELRAARDSAEQAKASAEEANRAKDHFLAILSHELRTPLTPVLTTASLLEADAHLPDRYRDDLAMIRRNVELEARLIDDLLDVTRIVRGKLELDLRPVAVCEVIRRAVEVCQPDIEARRLEFGIDVGPDTPYVIRADAARLQQVFWNLLKNAIKFTPPGGCVGVRVRQLDGQVLAEVNDTGIGIAPDVLPRLFTPFEQGPPGTARQFGGLGLGLTITKGLVEMHGGTIDAHSDGPHRGATFRVRLPLASTAGPDAADAAAVSLPSATVTPLRILLVEDHGDTARIMKRLLEQRGHSVLTAGDVTTALDLAAGNPLDLLISDLGLPDGSGVELVRQLHARGMKLPAIALSGYGQEDDVRRSKEAGFAAHLTKPTSPARLAKTIAAVLGPPSPG